MRSCLLFWIVVFAAHPAFPQVIASNVYSWDHSPVVTHSGYQERTLLKGTTRDFSHLTVQAITVSTNQPAQPTQQLDEEAVLIVKAGELTLTLGGRRKVLGPASVVVIMPGDEYRVENKATQPLTYYQMRYTSNEMPDLDLYRLMGGSFWVDWKEVPSIADHKGGVRQMLTCATLMSARFDVQLATFDSGLWSNPAHVHRAAEILFILDHPVEAHLGGLVKGAQAGDVIFAESDVSHGLQNIRQEGCTYVAFQF